MDNSLEQLFSGLAETAARHPILTIMVLTLVLSSSALHLLHFLVKALLLLVRSMRHELAEIGELAQRFSAELRLWRLETVVAGDTHFISLDEAHVYLQRRGIEPGDTIRVVSALADAWLAQRSRKAFNVVTNYTLRAIPAVKEPEARRYQLRPASLGSVHPGINLDKALALADTLEDEQSADKIGQRK